MLKELIINTGFDETRIALLEDGILAEFYVERKNSAGIVGNIYKGRVTKVLPGMQATFVNIGLEKDAFLYVMDVLDNMEEYDKESEEDIEKTVSEPQIALSKKLISGEDDTEEIDADKQAEGEESRVVQEASGRAGNGNTDRIVQTANIEDLLEEGQEVLVQVLKEPLGTKGARVTAHITLPGRYLVFMPTVDHIGISRRIENPEERERLKGIIDSIKPSNTGFIVRTAGEGKDEAHFVADVEFLTKIWKKVFERQEKLVAPAPVHQDLDIISRTIRDVFTPEISRIVIDSEEEYEHCLNLINDLMPSLTDRVKLYLKRKPVFDFYNVERQLGKATKRKVWLKSGGYIVIDETEALVAIDVNTGKYVGTKSLEETIVKINLEAIKSIAQQVRLRDLGGIIVIDFIDMEKEENRKLIVNTLEDALKADRTYTNVVQLSELGLVEMTRKRVKQSLGKVLTMPCPYCKASGRVKSDVTVFFEIQREISRIVDTSLKTCEILVRTHPDVARLFYFWEDNEPAQKGYTLEKLEKLFKRKITVKSDEHLHIAQFDVILI